MANKVSKKNISIIMERVDRLVEEYNISLFDEVKIGDEGVLIEFPDDECLDDGLSVDDFLDYTRDLDAIKREDYSTVRMCNIRQTILSVDDFRYDFLVPTITYEDELLTLRIVENPILIGFVASKEGIYNEDFGVSPCSMYKAVELRYKGDKCYTREDEDDLINRFLYHIASKYDLSIEVGEYSYWEDLTEEEKEDPYMIHQDSLIPFSEAMTYYSNALKIMDPDIQFHHLYKIIEHFSPVVSKKMAYEKLNQKLDTLSVVSRDYQYLDSLLDTARRYEISLKDKELCKTVLLECIDIAPLFERLPVRIQKDFAKRFSFKVSEIANCSDMVIAKIKEELGEIIYSTRNRIVHAKSNWGASDKACVGEDMEEMNYFMKSLAQCLIAWNGRQPEEFRV